MPSRLTCAIAVCVFLPGGVLAQSTSSRPAFSEFEVASIKPSPLDARGRWIRMLTAREFAAHNHALRTLIAAAYNLNPHAISGGAAWVDSEHYEILAKTPGDVRPNLDEQMSMLRKLLADRFRLGFHREPRELPVYTLTVAKGGPKLKETTLSEDAAPEGPPLLAFVVMPEIIRLPARYTTMGEFASVLQRGALEHPVLDKTGLTARYDFDLEFTTDESLFGGALGKGPDVPIRPGLFAAIQQQLGLRLEATKGTVDVIVIDRAERPSEN